MGKDKIYCKDCKHLFGGATLWPECGHPKNLKDSQLGKKPRVSYKLLNLFNNCKRYEKY